VRPPFAVLLVIGLLATAEARAQGCPWQAAPCGGTAPWAEQARDPIAAKAALIGGQADFMTANFLRSAEATGEAFRRDPDNLEAAIWHIAAMARLGQYPAALVATIRRNRTNLAPWPGPLISWLLGEMDRVAVQDRATDQNSSLVEDYAFSFFFFYISSVAEAQGQADLAEKALASILDLGPGADRQVLRAATMELGRVVARNDSRREKD
jgi:hypothetical protein